MFCTHILPLPNNEIHVWLSKPSFLSIMDRTLLAFLSDSEKLASNRFYFERDRKRFLVAHTLLRLILSQYTAQHPQRLQFAKSSHGKPEITNAFGKVFFNMSHSENLVAYVVAPSKNVGIDVQCISPAIDFNSIAKSFFTANELAAMNALPAENRSKAFYRLWTSKESFVKATGLGLSVQLNSFDTSGIVYNSSIIFREKTIEKKLWSIWSFEPCIDYIGAVAIEEENWKIKFHDCKDLLI